jgi:hypothetical protein
MPKRPPDKNVLMHFYSKQDPSLNENYRQRKTQPQPMGENDEKPEWFQLMRPQKCLRGQSTHCRFRVYVPDSARALLDFRSIDSNSNIGCDGFFQAGKIFFVFFSSSSPITKTQAPMKLRFFILFFC